MLQRQKLATLHGLALHCGYPAIGNKTARVKAIEELCFSVNTQPLNILSIDIGIKNFSYAKLLYKGVPAKLIGLFDWNHVNLHNRFGLPEANSSTLLLKSYMAQLAVLVVDQILLGEWVPSLILMESQRTRSNTNLATLPNVLLNYTLEHMIYAAFAARQHTHPAFKDVPIVATNSTKMVNFWMNRFVNKDKRMTATFSKKLRAGLLFGWLSNAKSSPIDLSELSSRLPDDFASFSYRKKVSAFLDSFSFETLPGKADDLVDCLLYNIASYQQLRHHLELQPYIKEDKDVEELVHRWDESHIAYVKPVVDEFDLEFRPEYAP
ncbi:hypothetical protein C7M61_000116 [Candidozyma pseudohaemuli]|uniref:Mitochondrial resolvase Ydc2 catalytic domain-containing protein n=1 Tax=Candidozyma pseudohaemuli TaxID=418784 RepID=A0A2P7YX10_9ASCO|nr:hypothetical protein C7M61_000116 [[Candida] pseudohaemulonii]PSK40474.1 hypothetical protein C7M61_000116 [[Candida] pseudohaemulonii]